MTGYEKITATGTVPGGGSGFWNLTAYCPTGKKALGGGWAAVDTDNGLRVAESKPTSTNDGWDVRFRKGTDNVDVAVYVICAAVD